MLTVSKSVFGSFILCIYTHPAAHTERDLNFSQGLDQTCAWVSIVRVKLCPPDLFPEMTKNFSYFCNYCWGYCACHDRAWKLVKKWTGCVELRDWWLHTTRYLKCNDPCLIASWYKTGAIRTRSIARLYPLYLCSSCHMLITLLDLYFVWHLLPDSWQCCTPPLSTEVTSYRKHFCFIILQMILKWTWLYFYQRSHQFIDIFRMQLHMKTHTVSWGLGGHELHITGNI